MPPAPSRTSEKESCAALATPRTPLEFRVGTDALAIAVSKDNTFLTDITLEQLALVFSTAEKWSDVDPSWPAETILRYSPGTDSGTFDYFVEAVMAPANKNADGKADVALGEEAILSSTNIQFSEDDNVLVQGVEGSPYAIGYFGYAYFQENKDKLNALSVWEALRRQVKRLRMVNTSWPDRCSSTRMPTSCRANLRWLPSSSSIWKM